MRRHSVLSELVYGLVYGLMLLPLAGAGQPAYADRPAWLAQSPQVVGEARFRIFIFDIYHVALVSPDGGYDGTPPYALKLSYLRDVERQAIVESSLDQMRQQSTGDEARLAKWADWMEVHFPDMQEGDEAIMVALVDGGMMLLHNGTELGQSDDPTFTTAFFGIWLSDDALRPKLSRMLRGLGGD
jgi:hypothetical protein